ncbi:MAG TPA: DNA-3-methyladenine glycosylase [Cyclobacteriaceae bacterium]|jgi:DNA-3-methyladenine glycosylase|nr:DNA-3-methyladenine glycosylase [Cyclobacteriaceae bacterium]
MKLPIEFYKRKDVVKIARELLGKGLFTYSNGVKVGGMIVETEAYSWKERGSHAYGAKKTPRNSIMFNHGGHVYVYLCYGMHHLVNVVTNDEDIADAVLIRAIEPLEGIDEMKKLRGSKTRHLQLTSGPGKLTKALGINRTFNGKLLLDDEIWIEDLNVKIPGKNIIASPRIGIDYAGEDAALPWRFTIRDNTWVSQ